MRKVMRIDGTGLFVEDVILRDDELTPTDCVETECQGGFYHPKWDGTEWVEGGTIPTEPIINPPPLDEQVSELQAQNAQMLLALVQGGLM